MNELEKLKREIRLIIAGMQNALEDDFEKWYEFDISNWISDLEEIKIMARSTQLTGVKE